MAQVTRIEKQNHSIFVRDGRVWMDVLETITIDGVQFERSGYIINDESRHDIELDHFRSEEGLCRCGKCHSNTFQVKAVSYTCWAICANCGFSSVVCDG